MDNLPEELFLEILLRLPVKPLLGSKLVCKSWRSHISNPEFVKRHVVRTRNNPTNDLFIAYNIDYKPDLTHQLFVINVNFHDRAISLNLPIPDNFNYVVESCNGLLCLAYQGKMKPETKKLYLWNPVTRQVKGIHSYTIKENVKTDIVSFGFGFDHATSDYKAVRIVQKNDIPWVNQVEVYSLKENSWKEIKVDYLEIGEIELQPTAQTVTVNGSLMYWLTRKGPRDSGLAMLSFNVQTQNFSTIQLPDGVSTLWPSDDWKECYHELDLFEFKESVALIYTPPDHPEGIDEIYTLDDDGSCWIKKLTIKSLDSLLGSLKTGELIRCNFRDDEVVVCLYDPVSEVIKPIQPKSNSFRAFNYTESLINLN